MKLITSQVPTGTDWAAWQTSCSGLHLIPVNFYDPPLTPNITLKVRPKGDIRTNGVTLTLKTQSFLNKMLLAQTRFPQLIHTHSDVISHHAFFHYSLFISLPHYRRSESINQTEFCLWNKHETLCGRKLGNYSTFNHLCASMNWHWAVACQD